MRTKPKMTEQEVRQIIADHKDHPNLYADDRIQVVGIRGYYKKTMGNPTRNDRNLYDDAVFIVTENQFFPYNFNTDPSAFRKGIASLLPGVYRYKPGLHGISRPGGGYPAFRPNTRNEELPVSRDGVVGVTKPGVAINIHKGGHYSTSSEGCQTMPPESDQWFDFQPRLYQLLKDRKMDDFPYILIEL